VPTRVSPATERPQGAVCRDTTNVLKERRCSTVRNPMTPAVDAARRRALALNKHARTHQLVQTAR